MSDETNNILQTGVCRFCGQVNTVSIIGDDPELLNEAATKTCTCPEAQAYQRKLRREKKVKEFLAEYCDYPADEDFMRAAIDAVELWDGGINAVTVEMNDGWKHKISLKDVDLHIKSTHTVKKDFRP